MGRNKFLKSELFQEQTLTRIMYNKTDSELSISDKMGGLPVKQIPDSEEQKVSDKNAIKKIPNNTIINYRASIASKTEPD